MKLLKPASALMIGTLCWNSSFAAFALPAKGADDVVIDAESILNTKSDLRGEITRALTDQQVMNELGKMGIEKSEVQMRLAAMSDQELQQIEQGVQRKAGGDVVVVGLTTVLLVAIILILLLR